MIDSIENWAIGSVNAGTLATNREGTPEGYFCCIAAMVGELGSNQFQDLHITKEQAINLVHSLQLVLQLDDRLATQGEESKVLEW
jgi:hypothetical protein